MFIDFSFELIKNFLNNDRSVWMSHEDAVVRLPKKFKLCKTFLPSRKIRFHWPRSIFHTHQESQCKMKDTGETSVETIKEDNDEQCNTNRRKGVNERRDVTLNILLEPSH